MTQDPAVRAVWMGATGIRRTFALTVLVVAILGAGILTFVERLSDGPTSATGPSPQAQSMWMKPSMGWNSWNHFACGIDETLIRQIADSMVSSGLQAAGYDVLTLDACWAANYRDGAGDLTNDPRTFPSGMRALGDYIHSRGLRYGIYASIGTRMCADVGPGSLDHEYQDVAKFASWGVDYIKADRCSAEGYVMKDLYARWRDAIAATGRPIVLSASDNAPTDDPWAWGPVTAHQWRISKDISDDWTSPPGQPPWMEGMIDIFDRNAPHAAATAPGAYNDPDMLEVGNGGMSDLEYATHFGLWALMSAPLIAGNDVRYMSDSTKAILTHPEVIAIDQDPLGFQAIKAGTTGTDQQVWYKPLDATGARAVGLLNRGVSASTIRVAWTSIGLTAGAAAVRDVWARADRGTFTDGYSVTVPPHGLALLRIVGTDAHLSNGYLSDQPWTYMANEFGPVERDRSNGESGTGDGRTIQVNGVMYGKGLGGHAPSALEFRPDGTCASFAADIGVDDEVGDLGSVIFQVWGDGQKLFESSVMTGAMPAQTIHVDITGRRSLRLQALSVDSAVYDHADWANANVVCGAAPPPPNQKPQASFTASPSPVRIGGSVTFDAAASRDPDGTIAAYAWDFGDGASGQGRIADHSYSHAGRFVVMLTVTDNGGAADATTLEVVADDPPAARFVATPSDPAPGEPIHFDASTSGDSDGTIVSYSWDFGDGSFAGGVSTMHSYARRGAFLARLEVTDDMGVTDETTKTISIADRPPVIMNSTEQTSVVLNVSGSKTFTVVANDPDGDALSYSWSVNGNPTGGGSAYTFVAAAAGTYVVKVLVSDGLASVERTWAVEVRSLPHSSPPTQALWTSLPFQLVAAGVASATLGSLAVWALRRRPR
jgi:alpha-galactosidase